MVKIMENPMNKWMIWGTPIFGNPYVIICTVSILVLYPKEPRFWSLLTLKKSGAQQYRVTSTWIDLLQEPILM